MKKSKDKKIQKTKFPYLVSLFISILSVGYFGSLITQIWLETKFFKWDTFLKISLTYLVLCGAAFLIFFVFRDIYDEEKLKNNKDII